MLLQLPYLFHEELLNKGSPLVLLRPEVSGFIRTEKKDPPGALDEWTKLWRTREDCGA